MATLHSSINWKGRVTTLADVARAGLVDFKKIEKFYHRGKTRTRYFADEKGTMSGYLISKRTFEEAKRLGF